MVEEMASHITGFMNIPLLNFHRVCLRSMPRWSTVPIVVLYFVYHSVTIIIATVLSAFVLGRADISSWRLLVWYCTASKEKLFLHSVSTVICGTRDKICGCQYCTHTQRRVVSFFGANEVSYGLWLFKLAVKCFAL